MDTERDTEFRCPSCGETGDQEFLPWSVELCRFVRYEDQRHFLAFLRLVEPRIRSFIRNQFATHEHASRALEDISQDTLIRLYTKASQYCCRPDAWPWVQRIARNAGIDEIRKASYRNSKRLVLFNGGTDGYSQSLDGFVEDRVNTTPDIAACDRENEERLQRTLATFSDAERTIYEMRRSEKTFAEIAEALSISQSTAFKRFDELVQKLRTLLCDDD